MLVIQNGRVIDSHREFDEICDIKIDENGLIAEIGKDLQGETYVNATGRIVTNGFIDIHVHFREPGFTHKEDILTGAQAAAAGGFTTVICMANTKPVCDNVETLREILKTAKQAPIEVLQCAAATMGLKGKEPVDVALLKQAGAVGLTDDGVNLSDAAMALRVMDIAKAHHLPISFHEEDSAFIYHPGVNFGSTAAKALGAIGADPLSEEIMIARDIRLAARSGARVNFQHLSTGAAVELLRSAKAAGLTVHGEVTPHHLSLTENDVLTHGTNAKMNPPLRTEADRQALLQGLADGTIDLIATDHAPHIDVEKNVEFKKAPSGIIGLETAFSVVYTAAVRSGAVDFKTILKAMSANPARLYDLKNKEILVGNPANLVVLELEKQHTYTKFASKSSNSPFANRALWGSIAQTIVGNKIVYNG